MTDEQQEALRVALAAQGARRIKQKPFPAVKADVPSASVAELGGFSFAEALRIRELLIAYVVDKGWVRPDNAAVMVWGLAADGAFRSEWLREFLDDD